MQIKKKLIGTISIVTLLLITPIANAGNKHLSGGHHGSRTHFTDYAKVVNVQPIFQRIENYQPAQECWYEQPEHTTHYRKKRHHRRRHGHNSAQTIVGGIVGGAIGNQLGRHSRKKGARIGATVAGAIIGSAIASEGHSRNRRHRQHQQSHTVSEGRPTKHCRTTQTKHYSQEIVGYDVTYRYRGHSHTTRLPYDPGRRLPIQVTISPQG